MSKPSKLCLSQPESFNRAHSKAMPWMCSIQRYITINSAIYNTDDKKVGFALSFMKKGTAATWADTFTAAKLTGGGTSFGKWTDFYDKFKEFFKHANSTANALAWLTTQRMTEKSSGKFSISLA
jgi:hypothetical protein